MSRAKYYISFNNTIWSEFWPTNTPVITWTQEGNEIFKRPHIDRFRIGRTKNKIVYDDLYSRFFDHNYFGTDIYYKINVLGTDKFYFIDPITSGNINTQDSIYESTPDVNDVYRNILAQYQRKWVNPTNNLIFGRTGNVYYPKLDTVLFVNVDFTTFTDVAHTITWTNNGAATRYSRNDMTVVTGDGETVQIIIKNFAGNSFWLRLVDGTFANITVTDANVNGNGKYLLTQNAAAANVFVEMSDDGILGGGSYDYQIYYPVAQASAGTLYEILDGVINSVFYMNLSITIKSTILWNDALPTGHAINTPNISTYFTWNPNNDYVIEDIQNWNQLWVARTDSFTTAKSNPMELSLKDVMDLLKSKLRIWWFIDPDGYLRLEHEKYFRDYIVQADLTSATYTGDKPEIDVKNYRYEKESTFNQKTYSENNQSNEDWLPLPVLFAPKETSYSVTEINLSNLSTDLEYILVNPGDASNNGIMFLKCTLIGTIYTIDIDQSTITPANYYANARLGWYYLFANYHTYFAEAATGTVNGAAFTFDHVKEFLKQNNIKFRMAADLDWKKPFTVTEGTGWLDKAEYTPETGMYKIDIGLNPYAIVIYVVDSDDTTTRITDDAGNYIIV